MIDIFIFTNIELTKNFQTTLEKFLPKYMIIIFFMFTGTETHAGDLAYYEPLKESCQLVDVNPQTSVFE